tara:strand:+ start:187 stop:861 length:675 start_codon:yes stop_codon:yes gene_type:complete
LERSSLAIIVPTFNEEKTIQKITKEIFSYGVPVIIDDCSDDKSEQIVNSISQNVIKHRNKKNMGYEKSIQIGFEIAEVNKFNYVITFDADGQHFSKDIENIKNYLEKGFDIVIGERKYLQRFSEKIFSIFFNFFFNISDPLSGLKGYNMKIFRENNHIFDSKKLVGTELLIKSLIKKKKIKTLKINSFAREGNSRYGNLFSANFKILKAFIKCVIIYLKSGLIK